MSDAYDRTTLHLLEILFANSGPTHINQLLKKFCYHRNVTEDMRTVIYGSEDGLRKFLARYPNLFYVDGDFVLPVLGGSHLLPRHIAPAPPTPPTSMPVTHSIHDLSMEAEAVKYFQNQLIKREERWVPIKSLAGHLSQASPRVRMAVGPQGEFPNFLLRHPLVFECQGELVGLKDTFTTACLMPTSGSTALTSNVRRRPTSDGRTLPSNRPKSMIVGSNRRAESLFDKSNANRANSLSSNSPPNRPRSTSFSLTSNEYKSILFLKNIIQEKSEEITLTELIPKIAQAHETIRNTIGWTAIEIEEFIRKNYNFFTIDSSNIVRATDTKAFDIIITNGKPAENETHTLTNRKGQVYHVSKLWGIIDLGQHEHVFFDKSIFKHVGDLQKHFTPDEIVYFNAIMAPKNSRAKWRATQVWKETDREIVEQLSGLAISPQSPPHSLSNGIHNHHPTSKSELAEDTDSGLEGATDETRTCHLNDDYHFFEDDIEEINKYSTDKELVLNSKLFNSVRVVNSAEEGKEFVLDLDNPASPPESPRSEPSTMRSIPSIAADESVPITLSTMANGVSCSSEDTDCEEDLESKSYSSGRKSTPATERRIVDVSRMKTVATQTVSTGEIMATQFYHDGMNQVV